MVAITFDDGYQSVLDIAVPEMTARGMVGTHYIPINLPMSLDRVVEFTNAGWEIGSHSMTQTDMTLLSESELQYELSESKNILEELTHTEVTSFASPMGRYNDATLAMIANYYETHVDAWQPYPNEWMNTVDDFDPMLIHRIDFSNTSVEEICEIVTNMNDDEFYVIIFHNLSTEEERPRDVWMYDTTPEQFTNVLDCVDNADVDVVTVSEGAQRMMQ